MGSVGFQSSSPPTKYRALVLVNGVVLLPGLAGSALGYEVPKLQVAAHRVEFLGKAGLRVNALAVYMGAIILCLVHCLV